MTKLDPITILEKANVLYREQKLKHPAPNLFKFQSPEILPQIQSDQVKTVMFVLVEEFNRQLEERDWRISSLEDGIEEINRAKE